jgi:hypothetical protein
MLTPRSATVFLSLLLSLAGCAVPAPRSIAQIEPTPNWKVIQTCGYESCSGIVDILKGPKVDIRVEAFNGTVNPKIFTIHVTFMTAEAVRYYFEPSSSFVTLSNGKKLSAKAFPCRHTIYSLDTFRSVSPITGSVRLSDQSYRGIRYDCFILFFDAEPPSVQEEFFLKIAGLKQDEEMIQVPTISFVSGIR